MNSLKNSLSRSQEGILGFLWGQIFKSLGRWPNGWTDLDQIVRTYADESGNGHRLKNIGSVRHQREHFTPGLSIGNICGFRRSISSKIWIRSAKKITFKKIK